MQTYRSRGAACWRRLLAQAARVGPLLLVAAAVACQVPAGPEREISGQLLYERHCARCHGVDGNAPADAPGAPSLANAQAMNAFSDEQLEGIIRAGRPPRMPAFGEQFLEPSRKLLVAYLRELAAAPAEVDNAAALPAKVEQPVDPQTK